jgi:hypothetical protein
VRIGRHPIPFWIGRMRTPPVRYAKDPSRVVNFYDIEDLDAAESTLTAAWTSGSRLLYVFPTWAVTFVVPEDPPGEDFRRAAEKPHPVAFRLSRNRTVVVQPGDFDETSCRRASRTATRNGWRARRSSRSAVSRSRWPDVDEAIK